MFSEAFTGVIIVQTLESLLNILPQVGRLEWIGLRPARLGDISIVNEAEAVAERGITGDHRFEGRRGSKRQVTLIQAEHLLAVAGMLHRIELPPELVRRNLVVSGINVLLEYSGPCEPCSRMETVLGPGGYNAMRGHGGITAKVIEGGTIHVGDVVQVRRNAPAQDL